MSESYYKNLSRKRVGVGALFFNSRGELLIVRPTYKDHWLLVGGVVDENESVRAACIREVKEEIGIDIDSPRFLCVDYTNTSAGKGDSLQFVFYGGQLSEEQIKSMKVDGIEIGEFQFLPVENALPLLSEKSKLRVPKCMEALKNNLALYLENGEYTGNPNTRWLDL